MRPLLRVRALLGACVIRPKTGLDYFFLVGAMVLGFVYFNGGIKAHAQPSSWYDRTCRDYKDCVPYGADLRWRSSEKDVEFTGPVPLPYRKDSYRPSFRNDKIRTPEGIDLYERGRIDRMCQRLGEENQNGQMTWFDTSYWEYVCTFGGGKSKLDRYRSNEASYMAFACRNNMNNRSCRRYYDRDRYVDQDYYRRW